MIAVKRRRFLVGVTLAALGRVAPSHAAGEKKKLAMLRWTAEGVPPDHDPRDAKKMLQGLGGTREEDARDFAALLEPLGFRLHRNLEILSFDLSIYTKWDETLPQVFSRMVAAKPDCIIVDGGALLVHLSRATRTIPIVTALRDPVAAGFAQSIARPGGNVTGIHGGASTLDLKTLDFLQRAMPGMSCVGWIGHETHLDLFAPFAAAARDARVEVRRVVLNHRQEGWQARLAAQFGQLREAGCTGAVLLVLLPSVVDEVAKLALRHRIAIAIQSHEVKEMERDGLLLQYASADDWKTTQQRLAAIVARILKGERPADIPFEGPSRYRLAVNLRTARRIGVTMPPDVMILAERVID